MRTLIILGTLLFLRHGIGTATTPARSGTNQCCARNWEPSHYAVVPLGNHWLS